jgi:hypothetical protein
MRITEILQEVFNTPAPTHTRAEYTDEPGWDWTPDEVTLNFTVKVPNPKNPKRMINMPYQLRFMAEYMAPDEVQAADYLPNWDDADPAAQENGRYVEFVQGTGEWGADNKTHLTGTGSSAQVYGIVLNAIDHYIKEVDPPWMSFHAATTARQRMYLKLVQRFIQMNPGWNYVGHSGVFIVYQVKYFGDENTEPTVQKKPTPAPQQQKKPVVQQPKHDEFQYSDDDDD